MKYDRAKLKREMEVEALEWFSYWFEETFGIIEILIDLEEECDNISICLSSRQVNKTPNCAITRG